MFIFLVWGFGLAAVSTVSLISLFMIIPLLRTKFYRKSLVFLIALAIGTLVGDSMFYLLPRVSFKGFGSRKCYRTAKLQRFSHINQ